MNQQPALAEIVRIGKDLSPSYDVQLHFNPLTVCIVEQDDLHRPIEIYYLDAQQFYTRFTALIAEHGNSLEHLYALLYLAKPYIDAVGTERSESSREQDDNEQHGAPTDARFVEDLMESRNHWPLGRTFVLDALRRQANTVAELSKEELAIVTDRSISPDAWQEVACEIRDKFNARYGE